MPPLAGPGNDTLLGGPGNDAIYGGSAAGGGNDGGGNLILGGAGRDYVVAGWGADTVLGGAGNDTIIGHGSTVFRPPIPIGGYQAILSREPADLLLGGAGNDSIEGGGGADTLLGGRGDDTLVGGFGADIHSGGAGADLFVFRPVRLNGLYLDVGRGDGGRDIVLDFQPGCDRLDLSDYSIDARSQRLPEPVFLGGGDFIATFGLQVRTQILESGNTLVQFATALAGVSGSAPQVPGEPTGEIELVGIHHLTASDFVLELPRPGEIPQAGPGSELHLLG
jgi:Ca2+-binding RTX toxin-like protein